MGDLSGDWLCTEVENFDKFMEAIGMAWMMRKAAAGMGFGKGKQKVKIMGGSPGSTDVVIVNTDPTGKESTVELKTDGLEYDREGPFGGTGKLKSSWEGNVLVQSFSNSGGQVIDFRRQIVGDKLEAVFTCKGVVGKRVFSKQ